MVICYEHPYTHPDVPNSGTFEPSLHETEASNYLDAPVLDASPAGQHLKFSDDPPRASTGRAQALGAALQTRSWFLLQ